MREDWTHASNTHIAGCIQKGNNVLFAGNTQMWLLEGGFCPFWRMHCIPNELALSARETALQKSFYLPFSWGGLMAVAATRFWEAELTQNLKEILCIYAKLAARGTVWAYPLLHTLSCGSEIPCAYDVGTSDYTKQHTPMCEAVWETSLRGFRSTFWMDEAQGDTENRSSLQVTVK